MSETETVQNDVVVWRANPGPQEAFLACSVPDVFFGGSRGGGKTDGLLGDFAGHAGKYGKDARGILFRRTLPELEEVVNRSKAIYLPLGWQFKAQKSTWIAPNGAVLRLAYLDNDADADKYQGHQYTWMAFDELGNWPNPRPIDRLWGSLRSPAGVPCVRRSTGNPGGPGHAWVKKRYIAAGAWNVHEFQPIDNRPDLTIKAVFIPSTLDDNPQLRLNDPTYEARLAMAGGEALFRAWRFGDWDILAGQYFDLFDLDEHTVVPGGYEMQSYYPRWISMDWGFSDDSAIHWHRADLTKKVVTYREYVVNQMVPADIGRKIVRLCAPGEKIGDFYLSRDAFHKRNSERTIADEIWDGIEAECAVMAAEGSTPPTIARPEKADDDRVGGWMLLYQMLKSGDWKIDRVACPTIVESLPLLVRDTAKNPEDCAESTVDHAPDSCRYGLKTRLRKALENMRDAVLERASAVVDITQRHIAILAANAQIKLKGHGVRPRRYR